MNNERGSNNFWVGFFLGGLFGAFLIFLWGTKEGKRIAKGILEKGEVFEDDIEEKILTLQQKGEALVNQAEEVKKHIAEEIEDKKHTVSDELVSRMDEALSKLEEVQKKGVNLTQDVHHHYFKKGGKPLVS